MPWVVTVRSSIGGCHRYWRTSWAHRVKRQLGSKQEAIHNGRLSTSRGWGQGQSRNGLTPEMGSLVRDALGGSGSWVLVWVSQTGTHAKWCKWSFGEWRNFLSGRVDDGWVQ
ncbi:hypothetical protein CPAR01_06337 [Colletotrichum paranaense]|uniref:Uncharacterized protein n=3 Tax=Colletotrichum acutatum species complex TaxID=2707335 RepID=A0AAI9V125_9PEZI|nr:uncharacterized protein CPAR01_06337 [Colletotrichum paranaense]KAK1468280.1 hypothetical protein CMEL01_00047 [Colletotrichum melonis]KAK1540348.1 hypothetical protein CPAR01_06337 [Colletotrichum paranaense]